MVVGDIATGTEVLVIGAGPGGYVAAIRAAQKGLDTTLVEKDAYGGACLNRGCIPSKKALITGSGLAHEAGNAESMGIHADPAVDMGKMVEWKDGVVDRLTGGVEKLCKANGVNLVPGTASFVDEHTARVAHGGQGQGSESIEFEHAIIATGSRPIQIPGFEFAEEDVWSSADALDADTVPDRLGIVGGGYIGMELATTYAKLGADVTVVEMLDDILDPYEDDVKRIVRKRAEELGVEFHFGEGASEWSEGADGGYLLHTETEEGEESTYGADKILVAVGRQPVTDGLDVDNAGIETDDRGFIETDDRTRTAVEHIHAVGDVAGDPMLAHVASKRDRRCRGDRGRTHGARPAGDPGGRLHRPEIGTVGMTEEEAEADGFDPVVGEMPFNASGRAMTTGHTEGSSGSSPTTRPGSSSARRLSARRPRS